MKLTAAVCAVVVLFLAHPYNTFAQHVPADTGATAQPKEPAQLPEEATAAKPWTVEIAIDSLTQYFYRGYNVVSKGWIIQPAIDFSYTIYDAGGLTVTPHVAGWFDI